MKGRNTLKWLISAIILAGGLLSGAGIATAQPAAAPPGPEVCKACHQTHNETYQVHPHGNKGDVRTPASKGGCVVCHGDGTEHVKAGGGRGVGGIINPSPRSKSSSAEATSNLCLTCHKGQQRTNWDGGAHQVNGVGCTDCHKLHQPADKVRDKKTQTEVCFTCHKEQRADSYKISSHPITIGKVVCSDCHNPHGSTGPKMLVKNSVTETCWTCHAEKRGPFLFEHRPAVESCSNCHAPHGSNIPPMLISRPPFMCQQCHDGTHASATPAGPNVAGRQGGLTTAPSRNLVGRACMNCHSLIHGSNSPAGGYFQR